jgi:hypothetical protein
MPAPTRMVPCVRDQRCWAVVVVAVRKRAAPQSVRSEHQSDELLQSDAVCSNVRARVCVCCEPNKRRPCTPRNKKRNVPQRARERAASLASLIDRCGGSCFVCEAGRTRSGKGFYEERADPGRKETKKFRQREPGLVCMPPRIAQRRRAAHRQTPPRSECILLLLLLRPTFWWSRCRSFSSRTARDSTKPPSSSSLSRPASVSEEATHSAVRPAGTGTKCLGSTTGTGWEDGSDLVIDWPERAQLRRCLGQRTQPRRPFDLFGTRRTRCGSCERKTLHQRLPEPEEQPLDQLRRVQAETRDQRLLDFMETRRTTTTADFESSECE